MYNIKRQSHRNNREIISEDSSVKPVTPKNVRMFMDSNALINNPAARNIPGKINDLFCAACVSIPPKVGVIYVGYITAHHITYKNRLPKS